MKVILLMSDITIIAKVPVELEIYKTHRDFADDEKGSRHFLYINIYINVIFDCKKEPTTNKTPNVFLQY